MRHDIWEAMISLKSNESHTFEVLDPAAEHIDDDAILDELDANGLEASSAIALDRAPLPVTEDREGYHGPNHFRYWASGLKDKKNLLSCAQEHGIDVKSYLDLGCASGRVIRHFAFNHPDIEVLGCDINRRHIEWVLKYLPSSVLAFQNHSIPSLPLPDNSVDLVSAFSVFTHIEAFESSWLMELRRILRPGGLAWITVHSDQTWLEMEEGWPLFKGLRNHPDFKPFREVRTEMPDDRMVFRWHSDRSYSSNVFYRYEYIERSWSRFLKIVDFKRRCPGFQDVVVMQKR